MSLKHQNSGKWAKSKAIMAKYDLEVRDRPDKRRWNWRKKGNQHTRMAAEIELGGKSQGLMKNQEYRKTSEKRLRQRENDQDKGRKR